MRYGENCTLSRTFLNVCDTPTKYNNGPSYRIRPCFPPFCKRLRMYGALGTFRISLRERLA